MQTIAILGSTGSIGRQATLIAAQSNGALVVELLSASGNNLHTLVEQCILLTPKFVFVDNNKHHQVREMLPSNSNTKVFPLQRFNEVTENMFLDIVVSAIHGFAGSGSTLWLAERCKRLAIANKETIICTWSLLLQIANKVGCTIVPIDSEHNAVYQLLQNKNANDLSSITITASGGAFFNAFCKEKTLNPKEATLEMALTHPKWTMGVGNTVNSATLVNKGIEVIETCLLFNLPEKQVNVVIHPQAILHGMANFKDGSSTGFFSNPDMKVHIANAIYGTNSGYLAEELNLTRLETLEFFEIDHEIFPSVRIARNAFNSGAGYVIAFNAANEAAVDLFIKKQIKFNQITECVERVLQSLNLTTPTTIEEIIGIDAKARNMVQS